MPLIPDGKRRPETFEECIARGEAEDAVEKIIAQKQRELGELVANVSEVAITETRRDSEKPSTSPR